MNRKLRAYQSVGGSGEGKESKREDKMEVGAQSLWLLVGKR